MKSICVTVTGHVAFDWKDYNTEASLGNILNLTDSEILEGYYRSGIFNRTREHLTSFLRRLAA